MSQVREFLDGLSDDEAVLVEDSLEKQFEDLIFDGDELIADMLAPSQDPIGVSRPIVVCACCSVE